MSIGPGLLASTSRAALAAPSSRLLLRCASSTSKQPAGASVQAADAQAKERERQMRRMPIGIDVGALYQTYVMEPIVEPRFQLSWMFKRGFFKYLGSRVQRALTTYRSGGEMSKANILPPQPAYSNGLVRLMKKWSFFPRTQVSGLVPELQQVYEEYNAAQARGQEDVLRTVSQGPALDRASKIATSLRGSKGDWKLVRTVSPPWIVSLRHGPVDLGGKQMAFQAVVRFDTEQELTLRGQKKSMRVLENIVFHRGDRPGEKWLVRDKLEETAPAEIQF